MGTVGVINYVTSGVLVSMTTAATSASFTVSPASLLVHQTTTYSISLSFYGPSSSGDYLILSLPLGMAVTDPPSCTAVSGVAALNCIFTDSTHLTITLLALPANSISLTASSLQNYDVSSTPVTLQMQTYSSAGYLQEQAVSAPLAFSPDSL